MHVNIQISRHLWKSNARLPSAPLRLHSHVRCPRDSLSGHVGLRPPVWSGGPGAVTGRGTKSQRPLQPGTDPHNEQPLSEREKSTRSFIYSPVCPGGRGRREESESPPSGKDSLPGVMAAGRNSGPVTASLREGSSGGWSAFPRDDPEPGHL